MEALYLLIPLSVVLVGVAVWVFFRMSDSGQFDDMDGPAHSILMDEDRPGHADGPTGASPGRDE
jgi:cbb3-type cytochrome oxidase maturation protein